MHNSSQGFNFALGMKMVRSVLFPEYKGTEGSKSLINLGPGRAFLLGKMPQPWLDYKINQKSSREHLQYGNTLTQPIL